jgi:hypothetical protein
VQVVDHGKNLAGRGANQSLSLNAKGTGPAGNHNGKHNQNADKHRQYIANDLCHDSLPFDSSRMSQSP